MDPEKFEKTKRHISSTWGFLTGINVEKAEGIHIYADDGRRYVDFTSGHAVCNIGHNHPAVVEAIKSQAERLIHSGSIFYYPSLIEFLDRLVLVTPTGMDRVFLSNSGSEAVEGAIKLARYHTGRQGIISFAGSFHGRTLAATTLTSSNVHYKKRYSPLLPSVYRAFYPYCYRCILDKKVETCGTDCLKFFDYIFGQEVSPDEVAAVIIEPVLGEGGYVPAPAQFLKSLREICTRHGIMLIFDEVQSGIGRTAKMFALEHHGVVPDIITTAKGIASGMPLSGVISTPEIMDGWVKGAHGTTFGGNPISCAAASATLDVIRDEGLLEKAERLSRDVMERLEALKRECPVIGDVRGLGYMIGVEFVRDGNTPYPDAVARLKAECLKDGLIIMECGTHKNVIRFIPPLVTTEKQMDEAMGIFEQAVRKLL
jgi:4-aminobutyrate aminotransferase